MKSVEEMKAVALVMEMRTLRNSWISVGTVIFLGTIGSAQI
jgi:hypothetical protein